MRTEHRSSATTPKARAGLERVGSLELDQDLGYQRREWRAERVGWVVGLVILVLAALGLFGQGPLSWRSSTPSDGSVEVSLERFARRGAPSSLVVRADSATASDGGWRVELSDDFVEAVEITGITPEPESTELLEGAVAYTFTQGAPDADLRVTFWTEPERSGRLAAGVRLSGHAEVSLEQFVAP